MVLDSSLIHYVTILTGVSAFALTFRRNVVNTVGAAGTSWHSAHRAIISRWMAAGVGLEKSHSKALHAQKVSVIFNWIPRRYRSNCVSCIETDKFNINNGDYCVSRLVYLKC
jgi:hypothetical protein